MPYIRTIQENEIDTVEVPQDGVGGAKRRYPLLNATRTVLSSFDTVDFPHVLAAKEEMKSWRFLELNPEDLRLPTQKNIAEDSLTQSGKNLAALLHRIKQEEPYHLKLILRKLQTFLPDFIELSVIDDNENKQYIIKLKDKDNREYSSRVLSEGTLRILALCILEYDHKHTGLLCFEEPENGIHPERVKNMVQLLKDLTTNFQNDEMPLRQVITNTHSPTFVAAIHKWEGCKEVELWFSEMRSRVIDKPKRMKINTTSISIVEKSNQTNLQFPYSKLNLVKLNEFLQITPSLS